MSDDAVRFREIATSVFHMDDPRSMITCLRFMLDLSDLHGSAGLHEDRIVPLNQHIATCARCRELMVDTVLLWRPFP